MGYLNNTAITVDAVLTKEGRKRISEGGSLNVSYFTLSDTGVDYTLWNADHASGSAFYGDAIENLPQVEALPNSQYAFRNKLVSLSRDTISMPAMELNETSVTFNTLSPKTITGQMLGYSSAAGTGGASSEGVHILSPDANVLNIVGGNQIDITGNAMSFIAEADVPQARLYEVMGAGPQYTFNITPAGNLNTAQSVFITIIHITTGTYTTLNVTVNANLQPETRTLTGQGQG